MPVDLSVSGRDSFVPKVVVSTDGSRATAVWSRFNGSVNVIQASSYSAGTWATPIDLSDPMSPTNPDNQQVAGSADLSVVTVVWDRYDNVSTTQIELVQSSDSGATWSPVSQHAGFTTDARSPQIASSSDGLTSVVVWREFDNVNYNINGAIYSSGIWGSNFAISGNLSVADTNALVACSADASIIKALWRNNTNIETALSSDLGATWSTIELLSNNINGAQPPTMTVSSEGNRLLTTFAYDTGELVASTQSCAPFAVSVQRVITPASAALGSPLQIDYNFTADGTGVFDFAVNSDFFDDLTALCSNIDGDAFTTANFAVQPSAGTVIPGQPQILVLDGSIDFDVPMKTATLTIVVFNTQNMNVAAGPLSNSTVSDPVWWNTRTTTDFTVQPPPKISVTRVFTPATTNTGNIITVEYQFTSNITGAFFDFAYSNFTDDLSSVGTIFNIQETIVPPFWSWYSYPFGCEITPLTFQTVPTFTTTNFDSNPALSNVQAGQTSFTLQSGSINFDVPKTATLTFQLQISGVSFVSGPLTTSSVSDPQWWDQQLTESLSVSSVPFQISVDRQFSNGFFNGLWWEYTVEWTFTSNQTFEFDFSQSPFQDNFGDTDTFGSKFNLTTTHSGFNQSPCFQYVPSETSTAPVSRFTINSGSIMFDGSNSATVSAQWIWSSGVTGTSIAAGPNTTSLMINPSWLASSTTGALMVPVVATIINGQVIYTPPPVSPLNKDFPNARAIGQLQIQIDGLPDVYVVDFDDTMPQFGPFYANPTGYWTTDPTQPFGNGFTVKSIVDTQPLSLIPGRCYSFTNNTGFDLAFFIWGVNGNPINDPTMPPTNPWPTGTFIEFCAPADPQAATSNPTTPPMQPICVAEGTLVTLANGLEIPIEQLKPHHLLRDQSGRPVRLRSAVRFEHRETEVIEIERGALAAQTPSQPLRIKPGHPILVDGREVMPEQLVGSPGVQFRGLDRPTHIYTLLTERRSFVLMQGVPVSTWAEADWLHYTKTDNSARHMRWTRI